MAVAVNTIGTDKDSGTSNVTSASYTGLTIPGSLSNSALLLAIGFNGGSAAATGISATWDSGGTNQAMTQIISAENTSSKAVVALFGLLAPTAGNKTLAISWTNSNNYAADAAVLTGVNQSSIAAAFTNAADTTNTTANPFSVAISSATGDIVVSCACTTGNLSLSTGTSIFLDTNPTDDVGGSYEAGASSVTLSWGNGTGGQAVIVGCNIVAAGSGTTVSLLATARGMGLSASSSISGSVGISGRSMTMGAASAATPKLAAALAATGRSISAARALFSGTVGLKATGRGSAAGTATAIPALMMFARGFAMAATHSTAKFSAALSGATRSMSAARSAPRGLAAIFGSGSAHASARGSISGSLHLQATGRGHATGAAPVVPSIFLRAVGTAKAMARGVVKASLNLSAATQGVSSGLAQPSLKVRLAAFTKAISNSSSQMSGNVPLIAMQAYGAAMATGRGALKLVNSSFARLVSGMTGVISVFGSGGSISVSGSGDPEDVSGSSV